jgi:methionyl-tRNA formyltransferase
MSLRIVLVGQAAFAEQTLERLVRRHEVIAAYCHPDPPSGKGDPFKMRSVELGIPVRQPPSMKADAVYAEFQELDVDLLVLAFVTTIIPECLVQVPRLGTICFHPSLLPRYRGASAINWQILRGEQRSGLTVFWPDAQIDTGPILLQKEVEIDPDDTTGSLYFNKIFPAGVDAMEEAVDLIEAGKAPQIPQDDALATYDPPCADEHVALQFGRPAAEVYNMVRGGDPQPGAWAIHQGQKIRLYDARRVDGGSGVPGEILAINDQGLVVALTDGALQVARIRLGDDPKKASPQSLAERGLITVGDRLESEAR